MNYILYYIAGRTPSSLFWSLFPRPLTCLLPVPKLPSKTAGHLDHFCNPRRNVCNSVIERNVSHLGSLHFPSPLLLNPVSPSYSTLSLGLKCHTVLKWLAFSTTLMDPQHFLLKTPTFNTIADSYLILFVLPVKFLSFHPFQMLVPSPTR